MDTLTHALSGALVAQACSSEKRGAIDTKARMAIGMAAAAFPDIDFFVRFIDTLTYLNTHRGITHSFLMLPLWALLLSYLFHQLTKRRYAYWQLYKIVVLCLTVHILGDLLTPYGTKIFSPLSDAAYSFNTTFVIDGWLTLIIIIGLWLSLKHHHPYQYTVTTCAVIVSYIGLQWFQQQRAEELGQRYIAQLNLPSAELNVLPQPLSPFNWKVIVKSGKRFHIGHVNLARTSAVTTTYQPYLLRLYTQYRAPDDVVWQQRAQFGDDRHQSVVYEAWQRQAIDAFRHFSHYPALEKIQENPEMCIWFVDLRFVFYEMTPPFRFGLCQNQHSLSQWELAELKE